MLSEISVRDLVETKGFESSLITTFNASLPFYEEILLRRLRANGCRHNVVLMDSAQCSASWESETTRPRHAGYEYSLIPIRSTGAFHPKVAIFAGPKKLALLVGSHNLTVAGLGFNREISNLIEIQDKKHEFGAVLSDTWNSVAGWLEFARNYCPSDLIAAGLRLQDHIRPFLNRPEQNAAVRFLAQSEHSSALFQQLRTHVTFPVRRLLVIGAFFDQQLGFLKSLRQWLPTADIVVGIDPETVVLPSLNEALNVRFVDARVAWPDADKYLHAKALYLEGAGAQAVFLSGSANPSAPGWGTAPPSMNTEAMILLEGTTARTAVENTGLGLLFGFQSIATAELEKTVARASRLVKTETVSALTILVGTVDYEAKTISVRVPSGEKIIRALAIDEQGEDIEVTPSIMSADCLVTVGLPEHLAAIRSLLLFDECGAVARVLVHHTSVLSANSASSRQQVIRAALGEIGNTETDVAMLIAQVQQVIFSAEASDHVGFKTSSASSRAPSESGRPETLAVDDAEFGRRSKKRRLIESGDLGYLMDTLIRLLHTPNASSSHHIAEPVSVDDEVLDDPGEVDPNLVLDDKEIAAAISRKSRSLIRKMVEREKQAASEPGCVPTMLVQLVAVLAILKELRYLERQGRWRNSSLQLVDSVALESLFQKSMFYLFSSLHRLWAAVEGDGDGRFEELDTLNLLLAWLAWEVGYTFTLSIPSSWEAEKEDRDWLLAGNGYLGKLLPRVGAENQWELLQTSILRTIRPIPKEKKDADIWLEINAICGDTLLDEFTNTTRRTGEDFSVGGFAYVPRIMEPWSVVLDFDESKVALWDFEIEPGGALARRTFLRSAVISTFG